MIRCIFSVTFGHKEQNAHCGDKYFNQTHSFNQKFHVRDLLQSKEFHTVIWYITNLVSRTSCRPSPKAKGAQKPREPKSQGRGPWSEVCKVTFKLCVCCKSLSPQCVLFPVKLKRPQKKNFIWWLSDVTSIISVVLSSLTIWICLHESISDIGLIRWGAGLI